MARPTRILIVEGTPDEERLALHELLKSKFDDQVKVIIDGQHAWDYLGDLETESEELIAVLLDLTLTRISGLDLLKRIRADDRLQHLHVVVMTDSDSTEDMKECVRLGVFSFVKKPLTLDNFTKAIADSFHDARAYPRPKRPAAAE